MRITKFKPMIFYMAVLLFGLMLFIALIQHFALTLPKTDLMLDRGSDRGMGGLVVATGGQARIETGLQLMSLGMAQRMLITGVGKNEAGENIDKPTLKQNLTLTPRQQFYWTCCVDLDNKAQDTKGNARAAKVWADAHGFAQLSLVTAHYHMPRALWQFKKHMPDHTITPHPVCPPDFCRTAWYKNWMVIRLLVREYLKLTYAKWSYFMYLDRHQ